MFGADVLTFREFMMDEPLPLATLHNAVLEFLQGRDDVVLFGAQAVNAYVQEPRMTQDLDLLSTHAEGVAQALCDHLRQRFHMAVRIRRVSGGRGLRVFQVRKGGNRHLVDLRRVETLPGAERIAGVLVMAPAALIASYALATILILAGVDPDACRRRIVRTTVGHVLESYRRDNWSESRLSCAMRPRAWVRRKPGERPI